MPEMSSIKVPKLSFPTDSFLTRDRGRVSRVTAARKDGGSGLFGPHTVQNKVHGFFFLLTTTFRIIDTSNQQWAVLVNKIHSRCERVPSAAEWSTSPRRCKATMGMGLAMMRTVTREWREGKRGRFTEKAAWQEQRQGSRPPLDQRSGGKPRTTRGSQDAIEDGRSIGPVWRSAGRGAAGGLHSVR